MLVDGAYYVGLNKQLIINYQLNKLTWIFGAENYSPEGEKFTQSLAITLAILYASAYSIILYLSLNLVNLY